jgi:uncharacterized membrane protein (Fun14 family)
MDTITVQKSSGLRTQSDAAVWGMALVVWFVVLCVLPCPRPLSSPEWLIRLVRSVTGLSEPYGRLVSALAFRSIGLFFLGGLISLSLSSVRLRIAAPIGMAVAALLAIAAMWFNYGYFPVPVQLQIGVASAILGVVVGFALMRSRIAIGALIGLTVLFLLGAASTGISDELDSAARMIGQKLLDQSDGIPSGDEGFVAILHRAFEEAEENSNGIDAVFANKAAILALGVILGEEKVARVARREIDPSYRPKINALRNRITLRGRHDLARHFWVSAALSVVSNEANATTIGKAKELMDSGPGGSGFSFVDMAANTAGIRLAVLATKNEIKAIEMRTRIQQTDDSLDICPPIDGLPEGMNAEQFQMQYGGIGGEGTRKLFADIRERVLLCPMLR